MSTLLVVHGAWTGGWAWKKMRPLLRARGHELFTPTLTGVGERTHLARAEIDLEVHVEDILGVLAFEDLRDVVLVGHSYGGMVATGVADRASERIAGVIYLDAFVPRDGQSAAELIAPQARAAMVEALRQGDGWRVPPNPMPPDTSAEDIAWATPRRVMQPAATLQQVLPLAGAVEKLPRAYIYCSRFGPGDVFRKFADRARAEKGWRYDELDASHNPQITMPETLATLLHEIAHDLEHRRRPNP
ncbi:MAG TPA: alpha/beta fold hydrolase [Caldimonas sp.]|jgi:pimeloyl-ACP methyl ester carboxylesterase